jgi:WD40 repeat protein
VIALLICTNAHATTLVAPCDRIIQELRAGGEVPAHELLAKITEAYKLILAPSLTISDLEGLLASPLKFNGWSNPTQNSEVGEILKFITKERLPQLSEPERVRFLTEIAPEIIREAILERKNAANKWLQDKIIFEPETDWEIEDVTENLRQILDNRLSIEGLEGLLKYPLNLHPGNYNDLPLHINNSLHEMRKNLSSLSTAAQIRFIEIIAPALIKDKLLIRQAELKNWQDLQPTLSNKPLQAPENLPPLPWTAMATTSNQKIYFGSQDGTIHIVDPKPKTAIEKLINLLNKIRPSQKLKAHRGQITSLILSPDEQRLYSASYDGFVGAWNIKLNPLNWRFITFLNYPTNTNGNAITAMTLSADGKTLSFATHFDIYIFTFDPGSSANNLSNVGATSLALSRDGKILYSSTRNHIKVWNLISKKLVYYLSSPQSQITALTISPDGKTLYSDDVHNIRRAWDLPSSIPKEDPR